MNGIRMMFLLGLLSVSFAHADGVSLEPGLWEMRFSMTMPMLSDPQERTFTDCVEETTFDPEDFQMDEGSGCSTSSPEVDGGTISWSMECSGPMGRPAVPGHLPRTETACRERARWFLTSAVSRWRYRCRGPASGWATATRPGGPMVHGPQSPWLTPNKRSVSTLAKDRIH